MYIEVYGLGHIGTLSLLHLAQAGFKVRGLDKDSQKVDAIIQAKLIQHERELQELVSEARVRENFLDSRPLRLDQITYIICVGTPPLPSGEVDLTQIKHCLEEIQRNHPKEACAHYIIRSTVPPGTCDSLMGMLKEAHGKNFDLIFFPEFIRTGQSWEDHLDPSLFIYARTDSASLEVVKSFPKFESANELSFSACEYVKYVNNCWHALKVAFVNEMAVIGQAYNVNEKEVFDIFLSDTKLNLGPRYLRPGPPYGGPCLQKEVLATSFLAKNKNIEAPIVGSIDTSNDYRIRELAGLVVGEGLERVILLGAGFRPGTEDERNSAPLKLLALVRERFPDVDASIVKTLPANLKRGDLIICGSIELTSDQRKGAERLGCQILDLGYEKIHRGTRA